MMGHVEMIELLFLLPEVSLDDDFGMLKKKKKKKKTAAFDMSELEEAVPVSYIS